MIRKDKGEFTAECDDCGEPAYGGIIEAFREFVDYLKSVGWKISKAGEAWEHRCPECAE